MVLHHTWNNKTLNINLTPVVKCIIMNNNYIVLFGKKKKRPWNDNWKSVGAYMIYIDHERSTGMSSENVHAE